MSEWYKDKLKNLTTKIGSGATPKGGEAAYKEEGIALIRSQNVLDFYFSEDGLAFIDEIQARALNNVTVEENDVLLNITGDSIARVCQVPKDVLPARVNQHVAIIRSNGKVSSAYLHYYLLFLKPYLLKICGVGGTRNALTKDVLEKLEISWSDDEEKIAGVLSSLDAKIELHNRINRELEAMAKTLYDYWFVQFDFPDENGKPYRSSGGKMVWNEDLKRELPTGWRVEKISDVARTGSGGTPKSTITEYYENGTIPWINSGELNNPFIITTDNFITDLGMKNSSAKLFPKDSILIALYGATAGKVSFLKIEATTNQAVCALIPKEYYYRYYIKFFLESLYSYLINMSSGSARDNLSQDGIRNLLVPLPSDNQLKIFHKIVHPLYEKYFVAAKQNKELTSLRDWLLPMLMHGHIKVQEAENVMTMAAEETPTSTKH